MFLQKVKIIQLKIIFKDTHTRKNKKGVAVFLFIHIFLQILNEAKTHLNLKNKTLIFIIKRQNNNKI